MYKHESILTSTSDRNNGVSAADTNPTRNLQRLAAVVMVFAVIIAAPATAEADAKPKGTYSDFIRRVWAFESSIDPRQASFYVNNWNQPNLDPYPLVTNPGRVVRDRNGHPVMSGPLTGEEYFDVLGISHFFDRGRPLVAWEKIQANVVNYLGFVGFQFQESDLHDLDYYEYATATVGNKTYPSHYVDVPTFQWADGVTAFLDTDLNQVSEPTWVTDVIHWDSGRFTGKNGVGNYTDFTDPAKHMVIIKEHFDNKYHGIVSGLGARGRQLSDYLGTTVSWLGLSPSVSPPPGDRSDEVTITMSGLLAGAHLRGAQGVVALLVDHRNHSDESGTYILQYVQDYAGYETPYDTRIPPTGSKKGTSVGFGTSRVPCPMILNVAHFETSCSANPPHDHSGDNNRMIMRTMPTRRL